MENIQTHIDHDKKVLDDPQTSPQARRHTAEELQSLQKYQERHPEDDHDPTALELFCDSNPEALECRVYDN
jgi:hypothetical protein